MRRWTWDPVTLDASSHCNIYKPPSATSFSLLSPVRGAARAAIGQDLGEQGTKARNGQCGFVKLKLHAGLVVISVEMDSVDALCTLCTEGAL